MRPDLVSVPTLKQSGQGPDEQFFSNAVIADSAAMTQAVSNNQDFVGQFSRSCLANLNGSRYRRIPATWDATLSATPVSAISIFQWQRTRLFERASLQFRAEFFNILNQHAFQIPNRVLTGSGFGSATSTQFDPREIQLGLRLIF